MDKITIRSLRRFVMLASGCLLCGSSLQAQPSPVGTWDLVLSGKRDGTAYITFYDDGTFAGFEALVPRQQTGGEIAVGRNGGADDLTRNGFTTSTDPVLGTQIFGAGAIEGPWAFDNRGRTVGYFIEVTALENCVTTSVPYDTNQFTSGFPITETNFVGETIFCVRNTISTNDGGASFGIEEICYTNVTTCSALTNAISFTGKVVEGKRITLVASTPFGDTTYRGVPAESLDDISGDYYGSMKRGQQTFQEFFSLGAVDFGFPNIYEVAGTGPGYSYHGSVILSSKKKMSFVVGIDPPNPTNSVEVIRAVTGGFKPSKVSANLKGLEQPGGTITNRITFKADRFAQ